MNLWSWSLNFGYNRAEVPEGVNRQLVCAGQTAVDPEGNPRHADDMRSQIMLALDNLEAVLSAADMGLTNVTRLTMYTTDMDEAMKNFNVLGTRLGQAGVAPPMSSHAQSDDAHSRLSRLRAATLQRAESLVSSFDDIVESTSDVAIDDEHDPEGHTIAWERQQVAALLDETRTALTDIEAAEQSPAGVRTVRSLGLSSAGDFSCGP